MKAKKWNLDAFLDKLLCGFHRVSASIVLFMTLYETCNYRGGKAYFVTANKEFWMELTCAFLEKNPIPDLCIQCCIVTQKSEPNSLEADPIWTNCMVAKHISLEVPSAVRSIESNIWKDDFITGFPLGLENLEKWEGIFQSGKSQGILMRLEKSGKIT